MIWRRHRGSTPALPPAQLATSWQLISLLLDYPDRALRERLPLLRTGSAGLPPSVGWPLLEVIDWLDSTDPAAAQAAYVDTFDVTRRCALHLTYYTCGDTRRRGAELIRIKQAYRRAGVELADAELPDHLSVVLEFGAAYDPNVAWKLLCDNRVGIELLHRSLGERSSPWAPVIDALRATLPPLAGTDEEALARLIAEGVPTEAVGLDLAPYIMPGAASASGLRAGVFR